MTNVGKVFQDVSNKEDYPIFAVGATGFIHLTSMLEPVGTFVPYGEVFPGPEFFDRAGFIQCYVYP